MTKTSTKRALYLRSPYLDFTGLEDASLAWLRAEGIEPVDEAPYDLMVYLPYDGGGEQYYANVSPSMASAIVEHIARGVETRQIRLRSAETTPAGKDEPEDVHEILESVDLCWAHPSHSGRPTLSIMTPAETDYADRMIRIERAMWDFEVGSVWRPKASS